MMQQCNGVSTQNRRQLQIIFTYVYRYICL